MPIKTSKKSLRNGGGRLVAKTSLKTSASLKKTSGLSRKPSKPKKRLSLLQKSAQQLIGPADKMFSRYIRLRDSEQQLDGSWAGVCITCPRALIVVTTEGKWVASSQNGHLIGRGTFSLRYDEENCNLQCAHCNAWLDKDEMIERYRAAVDDKYGVGTYKKLKTASKLDDALKRPTKPELIQIINDSKERVKFYLEG